MTLEFRGITQCQFHIRSIFRFHYSLHPWLRIGWVLMARKSSVSKSVCARLILITGRSIASR